LQDQVRELVKNDQLNFVNGGWCMHDEAATHYVAMVRAQCAVAFWLSFYPRLPFSSICLCSGLHPAVPLIHFTLVVPRSTKQQLDIDSSLKSLAQTPGLL